MALTQSDRAKIIAFKWNSITYLFSAGAFTYKPIEDLQTWQYSNGQNGFNLNGLHLEFTLDLGYLDQQLNAGVSYTLPDTTVYASAASVGLADVLNALANSNTQDLFYWPMLVDSRDQVHNDNYQVLKTGSDFKIVEAKRAGRFQTFVPISFITKTQLTEYPDWVNRG